MVNGPRPALEVLDRLAQDDRIANHHRVSAVGAQVLGLAGDGTAARANDELAAQRTNGLPELRYLRTKAHHLEYSSK